jgi:hypothetical protein
MRTLGFRTHVLLAVAAAFGLVATLSRPWFATAPAPPGEAESHIGDIQGPLTGFFHGVERWITEDTGTTGWSGLEQIGIAIVAMGVLAGLGALATLVPRLQVIGREALRYGAWVALAIVVWKLIDTPGGNDTTELRYGAFVALGCALMLVSCSIEVSNSALRGRRKPAPYVAPPAPPMAVYDTGASTGPPGSA